MLTAITRTQEQLIAWETDRERGPFFCPHCQNPVVLKKGAKVIHHFAHAKNTDCPASAGETKEHMQTKRALYEALITNPACTNWAMERYMWEGVVRPDLSGRINGTPVVIEIQRSNTDMQTIKRRFKEYSKRNVAMLWIVTRQPTFLRARLAEWKILLKLVYGGCLYFHRSGLLMECVWTKRDPETVSMYELRHNGYWNIAKDFTSRFSKPFNLGRYSFNGGLVFQPLNDIRFAEDGRNAGYVQSV